MACRVTIEVNGKKELFELEKVARQANGAVLLHDRDAVMLATVCREDEMVEEDFLPLTVQYVEKSYAAAKIPGGFIKRETKPGDFETLTSRIIDRSLRPLFPKGYAYPTQIVVFVLSSDEEVDLQTMALNAASAALYVSDLPVEKAVYGARIGRVGDAFVLNPSHSKMAESTLDLLVAGTKEELLMIEMRSIATDEVETIPVDLADPLVSTMESENLLTLHKMNELSNEACIEALGIAQEAIAKACKAYEEGFTPLKKEIVPVKLKEQSEHEDIRIYLEEVFSEEVRDALTQMAKSERATELKKIAQKVAEDELARNEGWSYEAIYQALNDYKRTLVRRMILEEGRRVDGRALDEVRPISIETNLLPSVHSSCLFTRGQTQALVTVTLGGPKDAQMYDLLTSKETQYEHFMVQYNFPGFSVGEASPLRAPGRRELGHGNLAKRALEPSLELEGNQTIRLVSEILESNGSSSMATVCGGSLALRAAGIETVKLVAGVAMGLVLEEGKAAILTDILGLEDHDGDMDFKVAGTHEGITALQMDIKLGGIDKETLKRALDQAAQARDHILKIMEEADRKIVLNEKALPSTSIFKLDPSTFGAIIGQAGKTIKEIIERFEVSVDLDRERGEVKVAGEEKAKVEAACEHIRTLAAQRGGPRREKRETPVFHEGQVFDAIVRRIADFGAFVELPGGVDGLLHISKLADHRVERVTDIVNVGDKLKVKILSQKGHKIELGLIEKL